MHMATRYHSGDGVMQSDTKSLEMYIRTAELGFPNAYTDIGTHYKRGIAVEQDKSKALSFLEIAGKKGSIIAHKNLALLTEISEDNMEKSIKIKHLKVVASAGDKETMNMLMTKYKEKALSKEELTQTLRAYQASSDLIKSDDRDNARVMRAIGDQAE